MFSKKRKNLYPKLMEKTVVDGIKCTRYTFIDDALDYYEAIFHRDGYFSPSNPTLSAFKSKLNVNKSKRVKKNVYDLELSDKNRFNSITIRVTKKKLTETYCFIDYEALSMQDIVVFIVDPKSPKVYSDYIHAINPEDIEDILSDMPCGGLTCKVESFERIAKNSNIIRVNFIAPNGDAHSIIGELKGERR